MWIKDRTKEKKERKKTNIKVTTDMNLNDIGHAMFKSPLVISVGYIYYLSLQLDHNINQQLPWVSRAMRWGAYMLRIYNFLLTKRCSVKLSSQLGMEVPTLVINVTVDSILGS